MALRTGRAAAAERAARSHAEGGRTGTRTQTREEPSRGLGQGWGQQLQRRRLLLGGARTAASTHRGEVNGFWRGVASAVSCRTCSLRAGVVIRQSGDGAGSPAHTRALLVFRDLWWFWSAMNCQQPGGCCLGQRAQRIWCVGTPRGGRAHHSHAPCSVPSSGAGSWSLQLQPEGPGRTSAMLLPAAPSSREHLVRVRAQLDLLTGRGRGARGLSRAVVWGRGRRGRHNGRRSDRRGEARR